MSDLVLEDWDIDFSLGWGIFMFSWTETKQIRVDVTLEFDTECEWKYFNGRDYEECTPVAKIASFTSTIETLHPRSGDIMSSEEDNDLYPDDVQAMQDVIDVEYPKYVTENAYDYL